jgi:serine protease Do
VPGSRECSGSGFLVPPNGLVITCRHIVVDAQTIEVQVPTHGTYRAELVGEDQAADLALLRLLDAPENLPTLALAVADDLRAGDWIVAVGNPFGFTQTVTAGIVSFVGRHLPHSDFAVTTDYLQISAPVNPGNSGCPVLDLDGRVVGLMTQAPEQAQGISFAVPSRTVAWALQTMLRLPDGRVRRGYLGIEFASRSGTENDGSTRTGAVIVHVVAGQAAHRAGVLEGDVVLEVDGTPVRDAKALHDRIVCTPPGTPIALQVQRKGKVDSRIVAVLGEVASRPSGLPN